MLRVMVFFVLSPKLFIELYWIVPLTLDENLINLLLRKESPLTQDSLSRINPQVDGPNVRKMAHDRVSAHIVHMTIAMERSIVALRPIERRVMGDEHIVATTFGHVLLSYIILTKRQNTPADWVVISQYQHNILTAQLIAPFLGLPKRKVAGNNNPIIFAGPGIILLHDSPIHLLLGGERPTQHIGTFSIKMWVGC